MRTRPFMISLLSAFPALSGCSLEHDQVSTSNPESADTSQLAIRGGIEDTEKRFWTAGKINFTGGTGTIVSTCSAVMLNCGVVVTAAHCINNNLPYGFNNGDGLGFMLDPNRMTVLPGATTTTNQTISDYQAARDIAFFYVIPWQKVGTRDTYEKASKLQFPKIHLGLPPYDGDMFNIVGYGAGDSLTSQRLYTPAESREGRLYPRYPILNGDSGGPIFAYNGDLLGITSASKSEGTNVAAARFYAHKSVVEDILAKADLDNDQIADACDPAPGCSNYPGVPDDDNDGIPNSCDDFPCHESSFGGNSYLDTDSDKVPASWLCDQRMFPNTPFCNDWCKNKFVPDNCDDVANKDQLNCNAFAEAAKQTKPMGDACDPVPCGASYPISAGTKSVSVNNSFVESGFVTVTQDSFTVVKPATFGDGVNGKYGVDAAVNYMAYRYCDNRLKPELPCDDPKTVNNTLVREGYGSDVSLENSDEQWRRISVYNDSMSRSFLDRDNSDEARWWTLDRIYPQFTRRWDFRSDFARLRLPLPSYNQPFSQPEPGRLWTHVSSTTGLAKRSCALGPCDSLSNNYQDITPIEVKGYSVGKNVDTRPDALAEIRECWACDGVIDDLVSKRWNPAEYKSQVLVTQGATSSNLVSIETVAPLRAMAPAAALSVSSIAGISLRAPLTQYVASAVLDAFRQANKVWTTTPEANVIRGAANPAAVALASNGTDVVDALQRSNGQLVSVTGLSVDKRRGIGATIGQKPSARANFISTYSRSNGLVFVVGGTSSATSTTQLGDAWLWRLDEARWINIASANSFGKVLAAVYAEQDNSLLVVDEITTYFLSSVKRFRRLLRVRIGSAPETIQSWTRTGANDRVWLGTDLDGNVVVSSTNSTAQTFAFAKLSFNPDARSYSPMLAYQANGTLALLPSLSPYSVSFVLQTPSGASGFSLSRNSIPPVGTDGWTRLGAMLN